MKEKQHRIPFMIKMIIAMLVFVGMFAAAMSLGAADISVKEVWQAITSTSGGDRLLIIREIRLPREIAAILVGSALAVAGAIMQGMTKNPLADPGLLGLTAGANAALALTIAFFPAAGFLGIIAACFAGAAAGTLLVFGISSIKKGGYAPIRVVLAGAAVSALLYAIAEGIGITYRISKEVSMWTAGGLIGTSWKQLHVISPFIVTGILIALCLSRQLTVLSLSEELATGLGQKTALVKTMLFLAVILLAGASVALVGNMAFLGLIIPHLVRAVVGTDYRFILPMSVILGSAFMLLADTLGRTINAPYETPVAAIVAMIGLPFFLIILRKGGKHLS